MIERTVRKVVVKQGRFDSRNQVYTYEVVQLVNTLNPRVGSTLTADEVRAIYLGGSILLEPAGAAEVEVVG